MMMRRYGGPVTVDASKPRTLIRSTTRPAASVARKARRTMKRMARR